jgi:hypothetical protein
MRVPQALGEADQFLKVFRVSGVDLQVPAILAYLQRHGLRLQGAEVVDIGSWQGRASHAISIRLSPLHVKVTGDPKTTLEQFWQEKKCLAVWEGA